MPVSPEKLLNYWDKDDTKERCGLILKKNRVIEVMNVHPQPEHGFEIDPKAILRHLDDIKGTWHTHPSGTNALSEADYICFVNWPDLEHYIIGTNGIQLYLVNDGIVYNAD